MKKMLFVLTALCLFSPASHKRAGQGRVPAVPLGSAFPARSRRKAAAIG